MPEIKFTVSEQAEAYLGWMAREILFVKTANAAAKHLMMCQLEKVRRKYRKTEPTLADLGVSGPITADGDSDSD